MYCKKKSERKEKVSRNLNMLQNIVASDSISELLHFDELMKYHISLMNTYEEVITVQFDFMLLLS